MFDSKTNSKNNENGSTARKTFFSEKKNFIQPKLTINQPNDIYEQEADSVAERVMRMPDSKTEPLFFQPKPISLTPVQRKCSACEHEEKLQRKEDEEEDTVQLKANENIVVQRKCSACEHEEILHRQEDEEEEPVQLKAINNNTIQRKCTACGHEDILHRKEDEEDVEKEESIQLKRSQDIIVQKKCSHCEEEEKLQTKGEPRTTVGMAAPVNVHKVINSHGKPIDPVTRNFMESRFGYDFGNVQIHSDQLAHQSAKEINALAYTHKNHVVFKEGQYKPDNSSGKLLLAHELAHVVQQGGLSNNRQPIFTKQDPAPGSQIIIQKKDESFNSITSANICDQTEEEKKSDEEKEEVKYVDYCFYTSKFPSPKGPCPSQDQKKSTEVKQEESNENNSYCKQALIKKIGDIISSFSGPAKKDIAEKKGKPKKSRPANRPNDGIVKSNAEPAQVGITNVSKGSIPAPAVAVENNKKEQDPLELIAEEVRLFSINPFKSADLPPAIPGSNLTKLRKIGNDAIKSKGDKILSFIEDAKLSIEEIGIQNHFLKGSLAEQKTIQLKNNKKQSKTKRSQVYQRYKTSQNFINQKYSESLLGINSGFAKYLNYLVSDRNNYKELLDLYNMGYEIRAMSNFNHAQLDFLHAGTKYGNSAENNAEWRAIQYEYAKGQDPDVQHKVMYEESDGVLDGKLTYNRFMARASAARDVGSSYKTSFLEQSMKQSNKVECGLDGGIQIGTDLLKMYLSEVDCFLQLAIAELTAHFEASINAVGEIYSVLMESVDSIKEESISAIKIQEESDAALINTLYNEQAEAIEKNDGLTKDTLKQGTINVALGLFESIESFQDSLIANAAASDVELNKLKINFEKNWEADYLKQYKILMLSNETIKLSLDSALPALIQPLQSTAQKGEEKCELIVTNASSMFSGLRVKGSGAFTKIKTESDTGLQTIHKNRIEELSGLVKQAGKLFKEELPEKQKKDFEEQTNCYEHQLYQSLAFSNGNQISGFNDFDKNICHNAEKAAAKVQPRWKFWAKLIVLIALALIGGFLIAAVLAAGLTFAAAALVIAIGAATSVASKIVENVIDGEKWHKDIGKAAIVGGVTAIFSIAGKAIAGLKIIANARNVVKVAVEVGIDMTGGVIGDVVAGNPISLEGILFGAALGVGIMGGAKAFKFVKGKVKNLRAKLKGSPDVVAPHESQGKPTADIPAKQSSKGPGAEASTTHGDKSPETPTRQNTDEPKIKDKSPEGTSVEGDKDLKGPRGEEPTPESLKDLDDDMRKLDDKINDPDNVKEVEDPAFRDKYDAEVEVGGHKFRRDKSTGRWCRFSDPVCNLSKPKKANSKVDEQLKRKAEAKQRLRSKGVDDKLSDDVDKAFDSAVTPDVTGGKKPRIDGKRVPGRRRKKILDIEDIPRKKGESMRDAAKRVRGIIGKKMNEIPSIEAAWERARKKTLAGNKLTKDNYGELYDTTRRHFWTEIRNNPKALKEFTDRGFALQGDVRNAARLAGVSKKIRVSDTVVSLDHVIEKSRDWKKALDADNLRFEFSRPNTYRETIQSRHPELRAQ